MENPRACAKMVVMKYDQVLKDLRRATEFAEENDFDARKRILKRVESELSELEDTTVGRGLAKQMYEYTFPFKEVYSIFDRIEKNQIDFPQTYARLSELSKSVPSLARESLN